MTLKVNIDLKRKFTVSAAITDVFTLLSDVPSSASHFPKVNQLTPLGDNKYRWEMEKVNLGTHTAQTSYACQYIADPESNTVTWVPIKGEGNSVVSGQWNIEEHAEGTHITFETKAELSLPLPSLLKLAISPLVKIEFTGLVETYISQLKKALN